MILAVLPLLRTLRANAADAATSRQTLVKCFFLYVNQVNIKSSGDCVTDLRCKMRQSILRERVARVIVI